MNNYTRGPCCFSEIQPCYQSFVLCFIVGHREVETNHAFNLIPFWRTKYNTCSDSLFVGRSIHVYTPLRILFFPLVFHVSELSNEVSDHLPLNGSTQAVLYIKFAQLYCPQCYSSGNFRIAHCSPQGLVSQDDHHIGLEVRLELAGRCNQSEGKLLHQQVPLLYTMECSAGVVHEILHLVFFSDQGRTNSRWRYGQVEEQFFPWFRGTQQRWGRKVSLQILECLLTLSRPLKRLIQHAEERQALVCCP